MQQGDVVRSPDKSPWGEFAEGLPRVVRPLSRDRSVGEMDPRALAQLLGLALLVLTDAGLFLLEDDRDACIWRISTEHRVTDRQSQTDVTSAGKGGKE